MLDLTVDVSAVGEKEAMVKCPKCDGEAPYESRFCPYCGSRLPSQEISPLAAILVLALTFIATVFGLSFLYIVDLPFTIQIVSAIGELMILLIPLLYMLHKKVNVRKYVMFGSLKHVGLGLGLGIGLMGLSVILGLFLTYLFGPSKIVEETNQAAIRLVKESPALMMLVAGLIPGICEEFAFRGFLQNALKKRYSFPVALLGASIMFGLFHPDPQATYTITSFTMGLYLGYFYNRFQSYVMTAIAHATNNIIGLVILLLI